MFFSRVKPFCTKTLCPTEMDLHKPCTGSLVQFEGGVVPSVEISLDSMHKQYTQSLAIKKSHRKASPSRPKKSFNYRISGGQTCLFMVTLKKQMAYMVSLVLEEVFRRSILKKVWIISQQSSHIVEHSEGNDNKDVASFMAARH